MDLASVVAALASVGVRVSGSASNSSVQVDSSRACPPGLAGPEPSGTINDLGQHFQGERQAKAQILTARKVEPKQAMLWMQMQRDAQVAACVDSTSRTVEVWGPTRQVVAMALYVGETVRRSRGMAGEWDPDTEMHRMRKVMTMVDYDEWPGGGPKGTQYK